MPYGKNGPTWTDDRIALLRYLHAVNAPQRDMITGLGFFRSFRQGGEEIAKKLQELGLRTMTGERTDLAPGARKRTLAALREKECRWPHGDPLKESFFFCGADQENGLPYCSRCASRAYNLRAAAAAA